MFLDAIQRKAEPDPQMFPWTLPVFRWLERLQFKAPVTFLVGENGSGKSTVMEMLAEACGLNPQGGSAQAKLFRTRDSEPGLGAHLIVERGPVRPRWSYFLRADTMHTLYTYLEDNPGRRPERLHELSHGEGFLEILRTRVNQPGFYLMDEPDAPLSFTACLGLVALLHDLAQAGSQAIVATHSPIVAAVPGASILELGDWGIRPARWEELHLVGAWRQFLTDPDSYFRHLLADLPRPCLEASLARRPAVSRFGGLTGGFRTAS
jgi:predicted ATPase